MGDKRYPSSSMNENNKSSGPRPSTGKPVSNARNQRKMRDFNERHQEDAAWSDAAPVPIRPAEDRQRNASGFQMLKQRRNRPPQSENKPPPSQRRVPPRFDDETSPVDDPLIIPEINGSIPDNQIYSQNIDMGNFPLICEETFNILEVEEPKIRRDLPFCVFQHGMNTLVQMHMQETARKNGDARFNHESPLDVLQTDFTYPYVINEYIKEITNTNTVSGDRILFNLPAAGTPQGIIEAEDQAPALPAGTYGIVDEHTHNAYECYTSPFVTQRLIEETIRVNNLHPPVANEWNPFPAGAFPDGTVINRNVLGYQIPEILQGEGRQKLNTIHFVNVSYFRCPFYLVERITKEI